MMRHFFIAPQTIESPSWLQAFPQLIRCESFSGEFIQGDCCWIFIENIQSFTEKIASLPDHVIVIAMSARESSAEARDSLMLGASGYVHYLAVPQVLTAVADAVTSGGMWLGADLMRQLVLSSAKLIQDESSGNKLRQDLFSKLTERERAVAECVGQGKSNKEIARILDITERTVKAHLGAIFEKGSIRDRLHLVLVLSGKTS